MHQETWPPSLKQDLSENNLSGRKPYRTLKAQSGIALPDWRHLWRFRDLLIVFAVRDVKLRYRQTVLGVFWVILQPLLGALIFTFLFGRVARLPSEGLPYFVFAFASLMVWNLFSTTLTRSSLSLVQHAGLVRKASFPRIILPLSNVLLALVDFLVTAIIGMGLMFAFKIPLVYQVVTLPLWVLLILMMGLGIGLLTCTFMVSYRDFQHILPVFTQLLLYVTPVAYATSAVPEQWRSWLALNPLLGIVEGFRWSLFGREPLSWGVTCYSAGCAVGIFALGVVVFYCRQGRFADVI